MPCRLFHGEPLPVPKRVLSLNLTQRNKMQRNLSKTISKFHFEKSKWKCHFQYVFTTFLHLRLLNMYMTTDPVIYTWWASLLTHWGWDKMDAISQTTFSSAFSWMKMFEFRLKLTFVPKGPINDIPALVRIMAWRRPGDKPLSEPMLVS